MTQEQPNLDSWEDFSGSYLKAEFVKQFPAVFIPISVKSYFDDEDKPHLVYSGECEGKKRDWEVNKTNRDILKDLGFTPSSLIGHKVLLKKVLNMNPQLKKRVPALEIESID